MQTAKKLCLACQKPVHGRSDKKFCNDYCRNAYNNGLKGTEPALIRDINQVLKRNRRLLDELLGNEKTLRIRKEKLLSLGFQFKYFTHQYNTKNNDVYCFCYDMGYLLLEHDWCLLVRQKTEQA